MPLSHEAGADPTITVPAVAWEHPLDSVESLDSPRPIDDFEPPARWWVRRRRLISWVAGVLLLLGVLAAAGAWFALGLQDSARVLRSTATAAQDQLTAFRDTVRTDPTAASSHLDAAALDLRAAHQAADTRQIAIAGVLPYAKVPVQDLDHLLSAADLSVAAGRDALAVLNAVEPKTAAAAASGIYANGAFNLPVLDRSTAAAEHIRALMLQAETELLAVDGTGVKEQEVPGIRDKALTQARDLRRQIENVIPLLRLMPPLLGAGAPRSYLVTILNQAEMHGSGGAPLSVGTVAIDKGKVSVGTPSATSDVQWASSLPQPSARLGANPSLIWRPVTGDPFWAAGKFSDGKQAAPFVTANNNPDFRVAGESMLRAWQGGQGQRLDGVIALDITAIRQILAVTGPVQTAGYGEVNAGNVAQILLSDVYATQDSQKRHLLNAELMTQIVARLTDGSQLVDKVRALAAVAPGRHIQVYLRDAGTQKILVNNGFGGAIATPRTGDHLAVYAQNAGLTKVDALQVRTIDEVIHLGADGSATVNRTVTQSNAAADRTHGVIRSEQSGWARLALIHLLPAGSTVTAAPAADPTLGSKASTLAGRSGTVSVKDTGRDQAGRPFFRQTVQIAPGAVYAQAITFTTPGMGVLTDTGMSVALSYDPDNALTPTKTRTVLIPPAGYVVQATPGVQVLAGQGVVDLTLDAPRTLQVSLVRG